MWRTTCVRKFRLPNCPVIQGSSFASLVDFESLSTTHPTRTCRLPIYTSRRRGCCYAAYTESMSGPVYDLGFIPPDAFGGVHHHQLLSLDPEEFSRCGHCGFGGCDIRITVCGCVAHAVRRRGWRRLYYPINRRPFRYCIICSHIVCCVCCHTRTLFFFGGRLGNRRCSHHAPTACVSDVQTRLDLFPSAGR
jgi:hypothetical protein